MELNRSLAEEAPPVYFFFSLFRLGRSCHKVSMHVRSKLTKISVFLFYVLHVSAYATLRTNTLETILWFTPLPRPLTFRLTVDVNLKFKIFEMYNVRLLLYKFG